MDRIHDDALSHRGAIDAWQYLGEVENNLGGVVADDNEVAVGSLRYFRADVKFEVLLLFFLVCHNGVCF